MNRLAMEALDDSSLQVSTQFCGTRKDPALRGSVKNIGIDNFTPGAMIAGVLNGMVDELEDMFLKMKDYAAGEAKMIVGAGNGMRRNAPLRAVIERRFGVRPFLPVHSEEAAFGAALFSLVACGAYDDVHTAQEKLIHYS